MNDYLRSVILGIVEGLTEFLPVSSTAHIRVAQGVLGIQMSDPYWKTYAIVIQLGAILSVVVYFRRRLIEFLRTWPRGENGDRTMFTHPLSLVMLAFVVTAGPAYLMDKKIGANLENMHVIGWALLVGGCAMWAIDSWAGKRERMARADADAPPLETVPSDKSVTTAPANFEVVPPMLDYEPKRGGLTWRVEDVGVFQAIFIGAAQILSAAFPGTSRSMSTIAAGQIAKLSRPAALEFSFFLSIPVMFAATGYKLLSAFSKSRKGELGYTMDGHLWGVLLVGTIVSFVVALAVIHWFMQWVRSRGFAPFAIYRIIAGCAVLWLASR